MLLLPRRVCCRRPQGVPRPWCVAQAVLTRPQVAHDICSLLQAMNAALRCAVQWMHGNGVTSWAVVFWARLVCADHTAAVWTPPPCAISAGEYIIFARNVLPARVTLFRKPAHQAPTSCRLHAWQRQWRHGACCCLHAALEPHRTHPQQACSRLVLCCRTGTALLSCTTLWSTDFGRPVTTVVQPSLIIFTTAADVHTWHAADTPTVMVRLHSALLTRSASTTVMAHATQPRALPTHSVCHVCL